MRKIQRNGMTTKQNKERAIGYKTVMSPVGKKT